MLGIRTLTAFIGLPIVICFVLIFPAPYFMCFIFLLMALVIFETGKIFLTMESFFEKAIFPVFTLLIFVSLYFDSILFALVVFLYFMVFLLRNTAFNKSLKEQGKIESNFTNLTNILFFSLYISIPFFLFAKLRMMPFGEKWFVLFLAIAWGGDTGGYFAGIYLRKIFPYKLFPLISPNKTWIGFLGSAVLSVGLVYVFNYFLAIDVSNKHLFIIALIGNFFSQLGDLFESFIKRFFKIKDSGSIIPGHGGILDRIDGLIFIAPFLLFYIKYFVYGIL